MLKRLLITLLALFCLCACQGKEENTNTIMIANPFTNCASLDEAEKLSGIELTLPDDLVSCDEIVYRVANSETLTLVEVLCTVGDDEICIRKALGSDNISGDYRNFSTSTSFCSETSSFTIQGDGDKEYLATWNRDDYGYSISSEQGVESTILQQWVYATK